MENFGWALMKFGLGAGYTENCTRTCEIPVNNNDQKGNYAGESLLSVIQ